MVKDLYGLKTEGYDVADDADSVLGPVNLNQADPVGGLSDGVKSIRNESGTLQFPGRYAYPADDGASFVKDPTGKGANAYGATQGNPWMDEWWAQTLSGGAKGVVRGVGLEVHPSLAKDTPLEAAVSGVTQVLHPGLNLPRALISTTQMANGQKPVTLGNVAEVGKDAFIHYGGMSQGKIGAVADGVDYVDKAKDAINTVF